MTDAITLQEESWLRSLRGTRHASPVPVISCWELTGPLDEPALQTALRALPTWHESLRRWYPDTERAAIAEQAPVRLHRLDGHDRAEATAAMLTVLRERFFRDEPPLWRAAIAPLGEDHYLFGVSFDKLITDGISAAALIDAISTLYTAARSGQPTPAPARLRPYSQFALQQRQALEQPWGQRRRDFWQQTRDSHGQYPPTLPIGSPAAPARAMRLLRRLPPAAAHPAAQRSLRHGVTEFSLVATAALQAFGQVTGVEHPGVVTNAHGRCLPGFRHTSGLFAHGIPVYHQAGSGDFLQQAAALQAGLTEVLEHALPLRTVDRYWNLDLVDTSSPPNCVLAAEYARPERDLSLAGLDVHWIDLYGATEEVPYQQLGTTCFLDWIRSPGGASLTLLFNPDAYPADAMTAVADHLVARISMLAD